MRSICLLLRLTTVFTLSCANLSFATEPGEFIDYLRNDKPRVWPQPGTVEYKMKWQSDTHLPAKVVALKFAEMAIRRGFRPRDILIEVKGTDELTLWVDPRANMGGLMNSLDLALFQEGLGRSPGEFVAEPGCRSRLRDLSARPRRKNW